ncbi:hypothetical protein D3C87_2200590 [compost metagenome]
MPCAIRRDGVVLRARVVLSFGVAHEEPARANSMKARALRRLGVMARPPEARGCVRWVFLIQ